MAVTKIARSAKTGRLVSKAEAKQSPDTTVVETVKKAKVKKTPFKLPKTLAQCADLAYSRRADRLEVQREATAIGEEEKQLKEHLIQNLPKSQASGVSGKLANAKIEKKKVPTIEDKKKLLAHVKKTGDWDLLTIGIRSVGTRRRRSPGLVASRSSRCRSPRWVDGHVDPRASASSVRVGCR